jgi:hypothetical protein
MRNTRQRLLALSIVVIFSTICSAATADHEPIREALQWIRSTPRGVAQYDYIMTARVRLLFFWVGKDDVGGGYIRRGVSSDDAHKEVFEVLFGSDPAKAPRAINRWGAGTEVSWHKDAVIGDAAAKADDVTASAFFGFMKASRGKSVSEMQEELKKEKDQGEHAFTGILSRVESASAVSMVVPFSSTTDFTLHQYDTAEPLMLEKIKESERPVRSLQEAGRCPRAKEFLATVAELMDAALAGQSAPASRCYIYDAQENTLTLESTTPLANLPVQLHGANNTTLLDRTYTNLLQMDFVSTHKLTGKKVYFSIVTGTQGNLRRVPVQVRYQPSWWFQVVLNLKPAADETKTAVKVGQP